MKIFLSLLIGLFSSGCVLANPAASKFTVQVIDAETSLPVTNAIVQTIFEHQYDPWGNKPSIVDQRKDPVDQNGEVTFVGKSLQGGAGGTVFADGYYSGSNGQSSKKNIVRNRWEPWNPTIEVMLRKKKNPVPMIQKLMEWKKIPEMENPVGYDLEVGDWVAPHGTGKISDFILTATGYFQDPEKGSEGRYVLSFSGETDGIQTFRFPESLRSSFKWPYEATLNGYQSSIEKYISWPSGGGQRKTDYDDKNNYIFRVRSQTLEDGSIVGCYGMISGELKIGPRGKIDFAYYFNPVPNERSLEYSGENLLKKNDL